MSINENIKQGCICNGEDMVCDIDCSNCNDELFEVYKLSPNVIVDFVRSARAVTLTSSWITRSTPRTRYKIVAAEYNQPLLEFKQEDVDETVVIDYSKVIMSFWVGKDISIMVEDEYGNWRLCADYDNADIMCDLL